MSVYGVECAVSPVKNGILRIGSLELGAALLEQAAHESCESMVAQYESRRAQRNVIGMARIVSKEPHPTAFLSGEDTVTGSHRLVEIGERGVILYLKSLSRS